MNHWLKRVALVAPPIVIAGIYFNVLPLDFKIKHPTASPVSESPKVSPIKTPPQVESVTGEVFLKEKPGYPLAPARGGELLQKRTSLATGLSGSAILTHRGESSWIIHLGPNSHLNVDELKAEGPEKEVAVNLVSGSLLFQLSPKLSNDRGSVRTKFANFESTRGLFSVISDGETSALVTVKNGSVIAEKFKDGTRTPVQPGHTYLINRDGEKKSLLDLDAMDLYEWSPEEKSISFPTYAEVVGKTGDLPPVKGPEEIAQGELLEEIDVALEIFRDNHQKLRSELGTLKDNAEKSREGYNEEQVRIEKDIRCIETSDTECNLLSEKILIDRGFPRLWGTSRYRHDMVVSLRKYLEERNAEVEGREEEAKVLAAIMSRRASVLQEAESARAQKKNLQEIIPRLRDPRLSR